MNSLLVLASLLALSWLLQGPLLWRCAGALICGACRVLDPQLRGDSTKLQGILARRREHWNCIRAAERSMKRVGRGWSDEPCRKPLAAAGTRPNIPNLPFTDVLGWPGWLLGSHSVVESPPFPGSLRPTEVRSEK